MSTSGFVMDASGFVMGAVTCAAVALAGCTHFGPATSPDVDRVFQGVIGVDLGPSRSKVDDGPARAGLTGEVAADLTFWPSPGRGFGLRGGWAYDSVSLDKPGDASNRVLFSGYPVSGFIHQRIGRRAVLLVGAGPVLSPTLEKVVRGVTTTSDPWAARFTFGLRYTAIALPSLSLAWTPFVEVAITTSTATDAGNYESRALLFGAILRMRRCGGGCPDGQPL